MQRRLKGIKRKGKGKEQKSLEDDSLGPGNPSWELDSLQDYHQQERKERNKEQIEEEKKQNKKQKQRTNTTKYFIANE